MKKRSELRMQKRRKLVLGGTVLAVGVIGAAALLVYFSWSAEGGGGATVDVVLAALSQAAEQGEALFNANCATCHGDNAAGTSLGPPLIHDIYNPGHHSDDAFYLAAAIGVRQHHWTYGDMPAQPQVSRDEVTTIIRYIRELQEANGIVYKPYGG